MTQNLMQEVFSKRFKATDPLPPEKAFTHEIVMNLGHSKVHCGYLLNGGFHVISGPTGVGKSTWMAMLAAATYKGSHMNINCTEHLKGKVTLWIDTEMPRGDFQFFQRDVVMELMNLGIKEQEDALWALNLTHIKDLEDKRDVVYEIFEALGRGGVVSLPGGQHFDMSRVGLVILDGIADISVHVTDETGIRREVEEFKHYVEKSDRPIVTVKHSDKKGNDPAGRNGTIISEKASGSSMMKSSGPGEPVTIKAHKGVRGTRPFRTFEMMWDRETGIPYIDEWEESAMDMGSALDVYENDGQYEF